MQSVSNAWISGLSHSHCPVYQNWHKTRANISWLCYQYFNSYWSAIQKHHICTGGVHGTSGKLVLHLVLWMLLLVDPNSVCRNTVFTRSDAAATIYFIMQFCAASIWERRLLNSVLLVKSFVNVRALRKASFFKKELWCDLGLKQTFQLLDQPPLCHKLDLQSSSYLHGTSSPFPRTRMSWRRTNL